MAQCSMVLWADEFKEVSVNPINTTQEVDQVTLRFGRQLQPPELARKEGEEEMALKELPASENATKQNGKKSTLIKLK